MSLEHTLLSQLVCHDKFARRVLPYIKEEYFIERVDNIVFCSIRDYINKYKALPDVEALRIDLSNRNDLDETTFKSCQQLVDGFTGEILNYDWLYENAETFCKDKAFYLAIRDSLALMKSDGTLERGAVVPKIQDAIAVSFDSSVGHDYLNDADKRYDFYHNVEKRVPFDLELFNKITDGGLPTKSLTVILAGTGVGKTQFMTHCATANMLLGKNVLYISLEMADMRIAERIDANALDIQIKDLRHLAKEAFFRKVQNLQRKVSGNIITQHYAPTTAHSGHFRNLLNDLKLKKKFVPDIIYIDYINLAASSRVKMSNNVNSYAYIKFIAEEFRELAFEFDVPIVTATQVTRAGINASDIDLTDTSDSIGLPYTADMMFALIKTDELEGLNQILVKQLKNRYNDVNYYNKFTIGIDRSKMRFYSLEDNDQSYSRGQEDAPDVLLLPSLSSRRDALKNYGSSS